VAGRLVPSYGDPLTCLADNTPAGRQLESEMIIELLGSAEGGLSPARVALRGHLERLKIVAQRCIEVLP
jgi:hypothetical protein